VSKRFVREESDRFHDYSLYIPARTVYMGSEGYDGDGGESGVDGLMAERMIKNLSILDAMSEDPIMIIMNNVGGDFYHGMAIYDAIKACRGEVTIKVYGHAMSMGAAILQAADHRILAPNSRFMIHYGTMGLGDTHARIFEKWAEESKKMNVEYENILLNKIHEKHPDFPRRRLQKMLDYDTILTAQETISFGLADSIIGQEEEPHG
jgi:ATP-dependent Clp protease, protease subunit